MSLWLNLGLLTQDPDWGGSWGVRLRDRDQKTDFSKDCLLSNLIRLGHGPEPSLAVRDTAGRSFPEHVLLETRILVMGNAPLCLGLGMPV